MLNLAHIMFSDSLPPICGNYVNNKFLKVAKPYSSLLHLAYASCGRVFLCLSLRVAQNAY